MVRRTKTKAADEGTHDKSGDASAQTVFDRCHVEELIDSLCFVPKVFVFDLDDTLWEGDVDRSGGPPFVVKEGARQQLTSNAGSGVVLFPDVVGIFGWLEAGDHRAAIASHTGEPRWAEAALKILKTEQGTAFHTIAPVKEMHRAETVAQRSKAVHLRKIAERSGCDPTEMVFFDNMEHNIADGESIEVTSCFTPDGLTWESIALTLAEYDRRALERAAASTS
eukprot:TRINITY_DN63969_c0_g1_i1.p1 TRINITY_DN63969_c0_g1~~TRINITY_DN63969_c0_g1_i1.p1  ORF type:complete len:223 (+),score=44.13 TRINITY_DN63969_c0_g1_i1:67-735(+)